MIHEIPCPKCGTPNPLGKILCENDSCGAELSMHLPTVSTTSAGASLPVFAPPPLAFAAGPSGVNPTGLPPVRPTLGTLTSPPVAAATALPLMPGLPPIPILPPLPNPFNPPPAAVTPIGSLPIGPNWQTPFVAPPHQTPSPAPPIASAPPLTTPGTIPCPKCGSPNPKAADVCSACRIPLSVTCPNPKCRKPVRLRKDLRICSSCARPMTIEEYHQLAGLLGGAAPNPRPPYVTPIGTSVPPVVSPITPPITLPPITSVSIKPCSAFLLILNEHDQEVGRFPLKEGVNLIGTTDSTSTPDVALNDLDRGVNISRKHATVWVDQRRLTLMDTGSMNHTFVDGICLVSHQPQNITEGSRLKFANLNARVVLASDPLGR